MGAQENGLTLAGLAQRLETLERENAELRDEVAELRSPDTRQSGDGEATSEFEGRVSRGALLSKAGAAAVAAVAAGSLLNTREAQANHFGGGFVGDFVRTHRVISEAESASQNTPPIDGANTSTTLPAVRGRNTGAGSAGVKGDGQTGVWGSSSAAGFSGVYGEHTGQGYGVVGDGNGASNAGVLGRNSSGNGVIGEGKTGVFGRVSASRTEGTGVKGEGKGTVFAGVFGINPDGYGGDFSGGKAQLRLRPGSPPAGKPTTGTHGQGELYMDSSANQFVCTVTGTPGTWRRIQTVAVA